MLSEIAATVLGIYVFYYVVERMEDKTRLNALVISGIFVVGYLATRFLS